MLALVPQLEAGLATLPYGELVRRSAAHMQREGVWAPGILRPSLLALDCRLARVKTFLGHAPQPGATFDHAKQGEPDPASNLVMARGAWLEGVVVAALEAAGLPIVLRSPTAVRASIAEQGWKSPDWRFSWPLECHPDLIIGPQAWPVQIKCPSDRALSYFLNGRHETVLSRYGTQIFAELYIMELAGWEPEGASLLMVSAEPWPPSVDRDRAIRAFQADFQWGDQQRAAIQARIDETKADIMAAREGNWPNPIAGGPNDWPHSYCPFPLVSTFAAPVACTENARWESPLSLVRAAE